MLDRAVTRTTKRTDNVCASSHDGEEKRDRTDLRTVCLLCPLGVPQFHP